jgi:catechol 2,3-dioxygenase-like lactoylglutathione lyase family enzyme
MTLASPIENIGQIAIRARDLPGAVTFYRDVLGLDYLFEAGQLAFFRCGDIRIMLSPPERDEFDHPSSTVYFRVQDLQAAYDELSTRGATFVDEPHLIAKLPDHELWMAFFRDPDGNLLALMSEVRES